MHTVHQEHLYTQHTVTTLPLLRLLKSVGVLPLILQSILSPWCFLQRKILPHKYPYLWTSEFLLQLHSFWLPKYHCQAQLLVLLMPSVWYHNHSFQSQLLKTPCPVPRTVDWNPAILVDSPWLKHGLNMGQTPLDPPQYSGSTKQLQNPCTFKSWEKQKGHACRMPELQQSNLYLNGSNLGFVNIYIVLRLATWPWNWRLEVAWKSQSSSSWMF